MTMDDERQRLSYKVVELATVDEVSLEQAVNTWVRRGWRLENVQFAMRESSRRPSMAFVFFTRLEQESPEAQAPEAAPGDDADEAAEALARLRQLAEHGATLRRTTSVNDGASAGPAVSAWDRLRQLAGDDDDGAAG